MTCCVGRLRVALIVVLSALALSASALADQSYTDGANDAGSGTDIRNLTVRTDASGGLISFQIASASPTVANHAIAVFIDTDKNQSTGGDGDEVFMLAGPLVGGYFASWNGSDFVPSCVSWQNQNPYRLKKSAFCPETRKFLKI